jgi:hypothetical protein
VGYDTTRIQVNATLPLDKTATITYAPVPVNGYHALKVGDNEIKITVSGVGLTSTVYTLTVNRAAGNTDNTLKSLALISLKGKSFPLTPAFNSTTYNYAVTVDSDVARIQFSGALSDPKASVTPDIDIPKDLLYGDTTFTFTVAAQDTTATSKKTYYVTVTRPSPTAKDASLKSITLSAGKLSPAFDPNTTYYTVDVGREVESINVTAAKSQSTAAIVDGPGTTPLKIGNNLIEISVLSEDRTTVALYRIMVVRSTEVANTSVSDDGNKVWAFEGRLYVEVKQVAHLQVYNILGVSCVNETVPEGVTVRDLRAGMYIVIVNGVARKVLVR